MITKHVDAVSGILIHRVVGGITLEELVEYTLDHLSGEPPSLSLWDATRAGRLDFSTQDLRTFLLQVKDSAEKRRNRRTALLFSEPSVFGLGRMLEVLAEVVEFPVDIRSFQDLEVAKKWLVGGEEVSPVGEDGEGVA